MRRNSGESGMERLTSPRSRLWTSWRRFGEILEKTRELKRMLTGAEVPTTGSDSWWENERALSGDA